VCVFVCVRVCVCARARVRVCVWGGGGACAHVCMHQISTIVVGLNSPTHVRLLKGMAHTWNDREDAPG
jgi:hypothetical protein